MNYKEKRKEAEHRILSVVDKPGAPLEARILQSNIFTLPTSYVMAVDKMLSLTVQAGSSLGDTLKFCREYGFLSGPAKLYECKGGGVSAPIGYSRFVCIDAVNRSLGAYEDANGRLPVDCPSFTFNMSSRLGTFTSILEDVYRLLTCLHQQNIDAIASMWKRCGIFGELSNYLDSFEAYSNTTKFRVKSEVWSHLEGITKIAELHYAEANAVKCRYPRNVFFKVSENGTEFYVVNVTNNVCYHFTGCPHTDLTAEELKSFVYAVAFQHGALRIEFKNDSSLNPVGKLLL